MSEELHIDSGVVPSALRDRPQWVCWRSEQRDDKSTKVPVDANTGEYASATDAGTWTDVKTALEYARDHDSVDGVGFVFTDDDSLVGVDLDDCRDSDTGQLSEDARAIVERLDSYTEVSPSGTGVHVIVHGALPEGRNRRGNVELYETARYFTVTGGCLGEQRAIHERTDELAAVHREYVAQETETTADHPPAAVEASVSTASAGNALSDDDLLEKARSAQNGQKFSALWRGDTSGYDSHSEADMALCCLLAFWTGRDGRRVDRLFRESGLLRGKWDEIHYADGATYGERTVERALQVTTDAYDPEHSSESTDASDTERASDATQPSDRSHAYLVERNRLLREQIDRLETDLEDADERIESLRATVDHLEADLASANRPSTPSRRMHSRVSRGACGGERSGRSTAMRQSRCVAPRAARALASSSPMSNDPTTPAPTANPFESDQAHEWVETGAVPPTAGHQSTNAASDGAGASTTADQPLGYTRCPGCDAREFVSRQLVYETRTVREDGTVAVDRDLRGELELVCTACGACLRELPASQRTFYDEVGVFQQDLAHAIRRQLRCWGRRLCRTVWLC